MFDINQHTPTDKATAERKEIIDVSIDKQQDDAQQKVEYYKSQPSSREREPLNDSQQKVE